MHSSLTSGGMGRVAGLSAERPSAEGANLTVMLGDISGMDR